MGNCRVDWAVSLTCPKCSICDLRVKLIVCNFSLRGSDEQLFLPFGRGVSNPELVCVCSIVCVLWSDLVDSHSVAAI